ncbi:MAG TPA: T9SS type A sorting domain-containing protein [Ohtaekwangia sp.]|uniref:T9SS type A sorting domain-containing protein n=1 Tax=Ohtaekwangia sp. TaxID=2066019 RepID=UPI002F92AA2A
MLYIERKSTAFILAIFICISVADLQAQARLVLNGATMTISQGAMLVIDNPNANAITRNSGYITSERAGNMIKWNIGTSTGTYIIPWGYSGDYIPVSFTPSDATGSGYFLFATYRTLNWNNAGSLPPGVTNFDGSTGDQSAFAVDRFWEINPQGYTAKPSLSSLSFTYRDDEYTATGNTIDESQLKPERWNSTLSSWIDFSATSTVNTATNTVTASVVDQADLFPWWTLSSSPLNRYWVSPALSNWNNRANWSIAPGGQGGATVPGSSDVVIFDGANDGDCSIDAAVDIKSLDVQANYSGTIDQGAHSFIVNGDATFTGGTFQGGSALVQVAGSLAITGTTFRSTSDTLDVKGDFTFSEGTFYHNDGTVKFSGAAADTPQLINGDFPATFNDIYITNAASNAGVSIESNEQLEGILTLAPNAMLDADGASDAAIFTLLSTSDDPIADAAIATLPAGAQVNGDVTVQRYMSITEGENNGRIFRYIASPVQQATVADIQGEIPVTGPFLGTSKCFGCSINQSMFAYIESFTTDVNGDGVVDINDGYVSFPVSINTEELQTGRGYATFVRGNVMPSPVWDVRGVINTGNVTPISFPVSFTSSGNAASDGWNLVGNPYPSVIDWNAASGWTKTNINGTIYIPDNGYITGLRYATWNGTVGTNRGSRYIATAQGFWVKASASPVFRANENVKAAGQPAIFFRAPAVENMLRVKLSNILFDDEAVVHFREDATAGFDEQVDAWKLKNSSFNLSTLTANHEKLSINSMPSLLCNTKVNLNIENVTPGFYTLKFSEMESFQPEVALALEDHYLNQVVALNQQPTYSFQITADPASKGSERFVLRVDKPAPEVVIAEEAGTLKINYTENIQWYKDGQVIEGAIAPTFTPVESGSYSVTVRVGDCSLSGMKDVVILGMEGTSKSIKIYPVPVTDKVTITVDASRQLTSASIVNTFGVEIASAPLVRSTDNTYTTTISMKDHPAGSYVVQLKGKEKTVSVKIVKK